MLVAPITLALALAAAPLPTPAVAQQAALKQKMAFKRPFIEIPPPTTSSTTDELDDEEGDILDVGGPGDAKVLEAVKIGTTDDALIQFFKLRTPPSPDRDKIAELVKQLGSKTTKEADEAQG